MRRTFVLALVALTAVAIIGAASPTGKSENLPRYAADGKLIRPANYREWVFLSSGLGMNYGPTRDDNGPPMFTNVFVQPEAYRAFQQTGHWPDKTMLMLEVYGSASNGSINRAGRFQTDLRAVEAHVKDSSPKGDLWKFYDLGTGLAAAGPMPDGNPCTQCHTEHGAVENTFVQFYPTLLEVALAKGVVKPTVHIPPSAARLHKLIAEQGWEKARAAYLELRAKDPDADVFAEASLNQLGYELLDEGKKSEAVGLFREVAAEHPQSANAQDSLADGYLALGDKQQALAASQKAIELAPKDTSLALARQRRVVEAATKRIEQLSGR